MPQLQLSPPHSALQLCLRCMPPRSPRARATVRSTSSCTRISLIAGARSCPTRAASPRTCPVAQAAGSRCQQRPTATSKYASHQSFCSINSFQTMASCSHCHQAVQKLHPAVAAHQLQRRSSPERQHRLHALKARPVHQLQHKRTTTCMIASTQLRCQQEMSNCSQTCRHKKTAPAPAN